MNAALPLCLAQALAPFAPPQSVVHQIILAQRGSEAYAQRRAEYFDECRLGMDCGPDDQDRDPDGEEEEDFEGAPV